jgi:VanZ family protein
VPPAAELRVGFRLRAAVAAAYWILIAAVTHWPLDEVLLEDFPSASDKVVHFSAFAVLAVLFSAAVEAYARLRPAAVPSWRRTLTVLAVIIAYAAIDELLQPLTNRYCDFYDWVADTAGATVGLATYHYFVRR